MDVTSVGYVFDGDRPLLGDAAGAHVTRAVREGTTAGLDGSFAVVVTDGTSTRLVTDPVGTVPVFYARTPGGWLTGTDFWDVAARLPERTPDPQAAVEMLVYNHPLGDRTLLSEIREADPGSVTTLRADGTREVARYWRHDVVRPARFDEQEASARLAGVLRASGRRHAELAQALGMDRVGVNLTAGRDSRVLAWMLLEHGVRVHCWTTRSDGEGPVAAAVARELGVPHTVMPMWSGEPDRGIVDRVSPLAMYGIANNPLTLAAGGPRPVVGFVSGHLGDAPAGSHLDLRSVAAASRGREAIAALGHHKAARVDLRRLRDLVLPEHRDRPAAARERLRELYLGADAATLLGVEKQVGLEQRQRRLVLRDYQALHELGPTFLPFGDRAWLDFWATVPFRWQLGTPLYSRVLAEHLFTGRWEGLARIPVNGRALHHDAVTRPGRALASRSRSQAVAAVQSRTLGPDLPAVVARESPPAGIERAGWVVDPVPVVRAWPTLGPDTRRAVETLIRFGDTLAALPRPQAAPPGRAADPSGAPALPG